MDTELAKVSKRNNFLVEELESWKQQFLKFQAFAEQLTKETQELKVKIENHKRENRRLASLIDQQKDEVTRLTTRLSGTEKQRDDALEALVLQQEIAEELEKERTRNKKELTGLQDTNGELIRHRDEAQRVVLHLRALIEGQSHHMEHILKNLHQAPELSQAYQEVDENGQPKGASGGAMSGIRGALGFNGSRSNSVRKSKGRAESEEPEAGVETATDASKSRLSMTDVADRYLRDKTDSITYIIRNISEQCSAAVEGLHLAQGAERDQVATPAKGRSKRQSVDPSQASEFGDEESTRTERNSVPPTPDLVHHRASTAFSTTTEGTIARETQSNPSAQQDTTNTKIANQDDEPTAAGEEAPNQEDGTVSKATAEGNFTGVQMPGAMP